MPLAFFHSASRGWARSCPSARRSCRSRRGTGRRTSVCLPAKLPLAHDEHEVALAQHLVDPVVLHRDAGLGHRLQRLAQARTGRRRSAGCAGRSCRRRSSRRACPAAVDQDVVHESCRRASCSPPSCRGPSASVGPSVMVWPLGFGPSASPAGCPSARRSCRPRTGRCRTRSSGRRSRSRCGRTRSRRPGTRGPCSPSPSPSAAACSSAPKPASRRRRPGCAGCTSFGLMTATGAGRRSQCFSAVRRLAASGHPFTLRHMARGRHNAPRGNRSLLVTCRWPYCNRSASSLLCEPRFIISICLRRHACSRLLSSALWCSCRARLVGRTWTPARRSAC